MKSNLPFYRQIALRDSRLIRQLNQQQVFHQLQGSNGLSLSDIARATNLSVSGAKSVVHDLIDCRFAAEMGEGSSTGGRRPRLYSLDLASKYVIGVDVRADATRVGLFRLDGSSVAEHGSRTDEGADLLEAVRRDIQGLLEESELTEDRIIGIGISVPQSPSSVRTRMGLPDGTPLSESNQTTALDDVLSSRIFYVDETSARLVAEMAYGSLREKANGVFVEIGLNEKGEGVRGSLLCTNLVFQGQHGLAGELGHIVVDPSGPPCVCGRRGCWHAVGDLSHLRHGLAEDRGIETRNTEELAAAVLRELRRGNESVRTLFACFVELQARAVALLVDILDPEIVVIGGEVARFGECFLNELRLLIGPRTNEPKQGKTSIELSRLGDKGSIRGAAAYVMQHAIELRMRA